MKFVILHFILFFGVPLSSVFAQKLPVEEEVVIREILGKQAAEWNNGNLKGFMEAYWKNDSLLFISPAGIKKGWQTVHDGYAKSYPTADKMGKLAFEYFQIRALSSEDALVVGKWIVEKKKSGEITTESAPSEKRTGHFTLLMKKFPSGWLIISDHTN